MSSPPKRVLVVDDYEEVRELTVSLLEQAGYEVISAPTGKAAIAAARGTRIDLLVVDGNLPDMEGDALARRLRETTPHLPVLLVTGSPADLRSGPPPWDVLQKPFMAVDLEAQVAAMLRV